MGYASETYFDVNCLVVNENTVIFSKENAEVFKKLEKHKITPIVCPFRHRLFWDGGIHCITLDLKRKVIVKDISDWIERISKTQKYGHPICPYAKKAKYLICENEDYKSIELKACFWTTDYDILVCIPTDKYMSVERAKQIEWNCNRLAKDTITLLDHPKDPGYIDGVFTGNGKTYFLIQPKKRFTYR